MPPKKKGKGNKLARMSEEEKLRYLQHRAAIEEEARRRKEHVIASYMKNKLKHEEAFTRLNTAKINQQWRQTLRQIKNKELHDASETLRQVFEVALKTKNAIINNLSKDLEDAAKQHGLVVQTHLVAVEKILEIREGRLATLTERFRFTEDRNVSQAECDRGRLEKVYKQDEKVLKAVITCEKFCYTKNHQKLEELSSQYLDNLVHTLMAEMKQAEIEGNRTIGKLKNVIKQTEYAYFQQIKPIQGLYNELLSSDKKSMALLSQDENALRDYSKLIEKLKNESHVAAGVMEEEIGFLKDQVLTKKETYGKMKEALKTNNKEGSKRIKHLAKVSNNTIDELEKINSMVEEISRYMDTIEKLQSASDVVEIAELDERDNEGIPLGGMTRFWERYGKLQIELGNLEIEYAERLEENAYLRGLMQTTLNTIARPSTVPSSLYRDRMLMKTRAASASGR
ncbi:coiled-coil domain containing 65 [Nesidiocoris tenuis]|uniref:Dynein regulatory complex subunit 2 n=1 Tax=Nesidiocoris tenuis TaxID=355587 RepID=A0ABN7ARU3_9HEMI|nr:coiled-coil domain containing 65 [Nesidiocoris tenuis]